MKVVVSGGTGFIGKTLVKYLTETQHEIIVLARNPVSAKEHFGASVSIERWNGKASGPWTQQLNGADAVVNLAGQSIGAKRWTTERKEVILSSRIDTTSALVTAMSEAKQKPSVLINVSGVGYYGNVENGDVTESFPNGNDFLANICRQWEHAASAAETLGSRVVLLRNAVVLERESEALKKMMLPFNMFAGGWLGSGQQWFPWVHRDDVVRSIEFALQHSNLSGAVNVVAPEATTNKEFCRMLGQAMHRPCWAPVPSFVLKTVLGEMSEMVLTGQRAVPKKLLDAGFSFRYPTLQECLSAIFNK